MKNKDESYLDALLKNVSEDTDSLIQQLNNDASSFQIDEKELDNLDINDLNTDDLFQFSSDFDDFDDLESYDDTEDLGDFDDLREELDRELSSDFSQDNEAEAKTLSRQDELDEQTILPESVALSEQAEAEEEHETSQITDEEESPFEAGVMDSLMNDWNASDNTDAETHLINDVIAQEDAKRDAFEDAQQSSVEGVQQDLVEDVQESVPESLHDDEAAQEDTFEDPMADVEDLLGLLQAEDDNPEYLEALEPVADEDLHAADDVEQDILAIHSFDDGQEESLLSSEKEIDDFLEDAPEKKKKIGFFKRLFGNIHDEKARKQNEVKVPLDKDGNPIVKTKKTKDQIKAEKAEQKKLQDEKKKEKADKSAEIKAQKEAQKKAKAEEKKSKKIEVAQEDEGRINRVGAGIVFSFFAIVAAVIILGSDTFSYQQSITNATQYFSRQKYNNAYNEVRGLEVKQKDYELYDKIMTVMFVNKQLNSYNNYYNMEMYPEALDSLLKGLQRYDEYISVAKELGIKSDMDYVRTQILGELKSIFQLSEKDAYQIIQSDNQEIYSQKVIQAASIN